MSFRKVLFWIHLCAGLAAGLVIAVMAFTGVLIAFEKELIAWAERDVRRPAPPSPNAARLPFDELLAKARETQPGAAPSAVTVYADPAIAMMLTLGRTNTLYANPYTGAVAVPGAAGMRAFMRTMVEWHRFIGGRAPGPRATGKAITGAGNLVFLFLAVSGLWLWWPRQWKLPVVRAVALLNFSLRGKARDWNWHNVIGLWSAPVLIVLTATAAPISYRWATTLIYQLTRTEPPGAAPAPAEGARGEKPARPAGAEPLPWSALIAEGQKLMPHWDQIVLRPGSGGGGPGANATNAASRGSGERSRESGERAAPSTVTLSIKERHGDTPRFATAQITLDAYTGAVVRQEKYSDYNTGRRVRTWTRFLHTGEALGPVGQVVAALGSLGGLFLVWTGFALAYRRFVPGKTEGTLPGTERCAPPKTG